MPSFELQFKTQVGEVAHAVTLQHTPRYTFFSDYAKYACAQCRALGKKRTWPLVRGKCACALRIVQSVCKAKHTLNSESFSTLSSFKHKFCTNGIFSLVSYPTSFIYFSLLLSAVVVFFENFGPAESCQWTTHVHYM